MAETLFRSLNAVGVVLLLTVCGYVLAALGWIPSEVRRFLSRYLMRFAIPVMCVYSLRSNLTLELLKSFRVMLLVPALCSAVLFVLSDLFGRLLCLSPERRSVFRIMCAVSNAMFIGYSMCMELFGEACVPYVMTYYLVNTSFAQLIGVAGIRRACSREKGSVRETVRLFLGTPSIYGVLAGILLIVTDRTPPPLFMSCARYINNTVTPLALLLAGSIIHGIGLKKLRVDPVQLSVMAFRFLLAPGLCLALCVIFGVTGLARNVLVVQTAMPVLTQAVVASAEYGGDERMAAQGAALTTLACFAVIPALMLLL